MPENISGNKTSSFDLMSVLMALKENILNDLHVADVCKIIEKKTEGYYVSLYNDETVKFQCRTILNVELAKDDVVLVVYTDSNFKNKDDRPLHSRNNAVIVSQSGKSGPTIEVIDNLLSHDTTAALSANQGRLLKSLIDALQTNLNSTNQNVSTMKNKLDGIEAGAEVNTVDSVNGKIGDVQLNATDVDALPNTTKYGASLDLFIDSATYVVTAQLKDQDGNNLGSAKTIDLPLESVVVSGSYDSVNKNVILTLKDGSTIEFSVADLVSGLQTEITSTNKLASDLVDDTDQINKFMTAAEKSKLSGIQAGAQKNPTNYVTTNTAQTITSEKSFSISQNIYIQDTWDSLSADIILSSKLDNEDASATNNVVRPVLKLSSKILENNTVTHSQVVQKFQDKNGTIALLEDIENVSYDDTELRSLINEKVDKTDPAIIFAESEYQKSKNLLDFTNYYEYNPLGLNVEFLDNGIKSTVNSVETSRFMNYKIHLQQGTYTISLNCKFITSNQNHYPTIGLKKGSVTDVVVIRCNRSFDVDTRYSYTFTVDAEQDVEIILYMSNSFASMQVGDIAEFTDIQLEGGSVATSYQPYYGEIVHKKDLENVSGVKITWKEWS